MSDATSDLVVDLPEVPKDQRVALAQQAWEESKGALSMRSAARTYGVGYSTLRDHINGAIPKVLAIQARQRLLVGEEECLRDWILQLASWGWPPRIEQLRGMAIELLKAKGDNKELGIHWTDAFLELYSILKSNFISGLDKERALAQDPSIVKAW